MPQFTDIQEDRTTLSTVALKQPMGVLKLMLSVHSVNHSFTKQQQKKTKEKKNNQILRFFHSGSFSASSSSSESSANMGTGWVLEKKKKKKHKDQTALNLQQRKHAVF